MVDDHRETPAAAGSGARPCTRYGAHPGAHPAARPGAHPGARPVSRPGAHPGAHPAALVAMLLLASLLPLARAAGPEGEAVLDGAMALRLLRSLPADALAAAAGAEAGAAAGANEGAEMGADVGAEAGAAARADWVELDWALVTALEPSEACAAPRPPCPAGAPPRYRIVTARGGARAPALADVEGLALPDPLPLAGQDRAPAGGAPSTADPALPRIEAPAPGSVVSAPLRVAGVAPGTWFFEAVVPMGLLDADGETLARGIGLAEGSWMTTDPVRFSGTLDELPPGRAGPLALALERDDPGGLTRNAGVLLVPLAGTAP